MNRFYKNKPISLYNRKIKLIWKHNKKYRIGIYDTFNPCVKDKIINEDTGIQESLIDFTNVVTYESFDQAPYINTEWYNPIHNINNDFVIEYYVMDRDQEDYFYDKYNKDFLVIFNYDNKDFIRKVKAGNHRINLGKVSSIGEKYFSIQAIDLSNKYASCVHWKRIMIVDDSYEITDAQTYYMTEQDIIDYNIIVKEDNSDKISDEEAAANIAKVNQLMQNKKDLGYKKFVWYNPNGDNDNRYVYYFQPYDTRDNPIIIPNGLTVDLNRCKWKQLVSYGGGSLLVKFLEDSNDSHLINGYVWGDYDEHIVDKTREDYPNQGYTGIEGEGYNLISLCGAFNSIENLDAGWCTGYSICAGNNTWGYKYTSKEFKNWQNVYIDDKGIEHQSDSDIWTNGYEDIPSASYKYRFAQACNRLGYSGMRGKVNDLILSYYDENKNFIKQEKVRQYGLSYKPDNARYIRITMCSNTSEELVDDTSSTPFHLEYKNYKATTCWLCKDNYIHDCRTVAYATGVYDHLTWDNEVIENCGQWLGPNNGQVTALAIDVEDGYQHSEALYIKNITCLAGEKGNTSVNLVTTYDVHAYGINDCNLRCHKTFGLNLQNVTLQGLYVGRGEHFRYGFMMIQNCKSFGDTIFLCTENEDHPDTLVKNCEIKAQINTHSAVNVYRLTFKDCIITKLPRGNLFNSTEKHVGCRMNFETYTYLHMSIEYENCFLTTDTTGPMMILHASDITCIFNNCDINVNYREHDLTAKTNCYMIFNNCRLNKNYYTVDKDYIIKNNCELVDFE